MKKVIVVGGGAAGMIAAGRSAELGNRVVLLEKNDSLGKKLLITGKGRCNLTNAADVDGIIQNICTNPRFMYSSLNSFDSRALMAFFQTLGLETKIERGNRVFPASDRSSDVVRALENYMRGNGVEICLKTAVKEIKAADNRVKAVVGASREFEADSVIIATGGLSYPLTGSTGDGYAFAKSMGHKVTKLYPSLVPLRVAEKWPARLQGLSLRNIAVKLFEGHELLYSGFGEMLFTHYGVSGPLILSASRYVLGKYDRNCSIHIDLKPALSEEKLDERILRDFDKFKNRELKNSLGELLPSKLIPVIAELSGIPSKRVNEVTREERRGLVSLLKSLKVTVNGALGYNSAVITVGGVAADGINPKTMESKLVKGLYFCGEVIDIDAYTGGFNLQIAFSTGYAAGTSA